MGELARSRLIQQNLRPAAAVVVVVVETIGPQSPVSPFPRGGLISTERAWMHLRLVKEVVFSLGPVAAQRSLLDALLP